MQIEAAAVPAGRMLPNQSSRVRSRRIRAFPFLQVAEKGGMRPDFKTFVTVTNLQV